MLKLYYGLSEEEAAGCPLGPDPLDPTDLNLILLKLFQKLKRRKQPPKSFYEVTVTLKPKPEKAKTKKEITLPTPVFWPGEFHGLYSPWDCKELDTTE